MNHQKDMSRLSPQILEQASTWFVEFSEGRVDTASREEFIRWLRISPEHVRAYLQIAAFWEDAPLIDKKREAGADVLTARALAEGNVVPLELAGPPALQAAGQYVAPSYAADTYSGRRFAVAASVAFLALVGGLSSYQFLRAPTYATDIGEQRSVRLEDGSTVDLNSRSRIRVRFGEVGRVVELVEGQALFRVAKDAVRPFTVRSGETSVRAVGTQFDVYQRKSGTTVTVLEGSVSVVALTRDMSGSEPARQAIGAVPNTTIGSTGGARTSVLVSAGEQITVTPMTRAEPQPANITAATAWTRREIVFQGAPLTDVVEEFNRYNTKQLVIADASIEGTRISGVFSSTDPSALLLFLRELPEFRIQEEDDTIHITGR